MQKFLEPCYEWITENWNHIEKIGSGRDYKKSLDTLSFQLIEDHQYLASVDPENRIISYDQEKYNLSSHKERTAILIHETIEFFLYDTCLVDGMGFGIIRPEHEYAEYVEGEYRKDMGLPECENKLNKDELNRMVKLDAYFRKFPKYYRYICNTVYDELLDYPNSKINDLFYKRMYEKRRFKKYS